MRVGAVPRLLRLPAAMLLAARHRLSARPLGLVVLYHRITEERVPPSRLVPAVRARDFERQLRLLRAWYRVVPLSRLEAAIRERGRGGRIPVAITFDDDLPEHLAVAAPRLRAVHAPATFFLCGASLDALRPFWWEPLQDAADRNLDLPALLGPAMPLPAAASVTEIAGAVKSLTPSRQAEIGRLLEQHSGAVRHDALDAQRVRALAREFDVGFHTREHAYLPALDDVDLARAMTDGRDPLEELTGRPLNCIAYPHGGIDERTAPAARAAGFRMGLTTEPRAVGADPMLVGRVEPAPAPLDEYWFRLERALRRAP